MGLSRFLLLELTHSALFSLHDNWCYFFTCSSNVWAQASSTSSRLWWLFFFFKKNKFSLFSSSRAKPLYVIKFLSDKFFFFFFVWKIGSALYKHIWHFTYLKMRPFYLHPLSWCVVWWTRSKREIVSDSEDMLGTRRFPSGVCEDCWNPSAFALKDTGQLISLCPPSLGASHQWGATNYYPVSDFPEIVICPFPSLLPET